MKDTYDESMSDETDLDEDALFREHVIGEDHDLLALDNLLKDAFSQEISE